jgi:serine/threonine-protein kinase
MMAPMPDATTTVATATPRVLDDRYELLDVLGQGAMGVVYRARDRQLDRIVAIKTIHHAGAAEPGAARGARLQLEATAAARLSHPGIVTIHDVGFADDLPYVVMEYVRGRTLSSLLARRPLPPARAVHVVVQICRALQYAHAEGVVHRDVKSSNIMVDASWRAKLTDFGVARVVGRRESDTTIVGTPAYIAPEHARGGTADARSDLFSLGVVLYESLTGERPFPSDDFTTVLHEVVHLDPVPARERNFAVSPALDAVVRRVMSKDPDDRYPDAGAFADALTQALAEAPGPLGRAWAATGRRAAAFLVVALGLTAAGAATWLVPGDRPAAVRDEPPAVAPVTPVVVAPVPEPAAAPAEPAMAPPAEATSPPVAAPRRRPVPRPRVVIEPPPRARVVVEPPPPPRVVIEPPPRPRVVTEAPPEAPPVVVARPAPVEPERPPGTPPTGCLSVNAVPFATVYVDGRALAETPRACVRLSLGRHRLVFESMDERSPEETVVIEEQHTAETPLRVSYDFRTRQFLAR